MHPLKSPLYIVEMDRNLNYPFKGPKQSGFLARARSRIEFDGTGNAHLIVSKLISVDSPYLIKIVEVVESYMSSDYTIHYEYVPYPLTYENEKIKFYLASEVCLRNLNELFISLIKKGVTPTLNPAHFGFTAGFSLKYYLHPSFSKFPIIKGDKIEEAAKNYANQCYKMFHLYISAEKTSPISSLNGFRESLKHLKPEISEKKDHERSNSGERRNQSDNSETLPRPTEREHSATHSGEREARNFEDSYSMREDRKGKKKRTSSFREDKPRSEVKVKKTSWGEEKSVVKNESDRSTVLQKRINEALMKTEKTLRKYEKIRSRSLKKKNVLH